MSHRPRYRLVLHPTNPHKKRAIDAALLEVRDVVVHAQTGLGKTLSYMMAMLARIDGSCAAVHALVVVPMRKFALQALRWCTSGQCKSGRAFSSDFGSCVCAEKKHAAGLHRFICKGCETTMTEEEEGAKKGDARPFHQCNIVDTRSLPPLGNCKFTTHPPVWHC